jgi:hypothetical protein
MYEGVRKINKIYKHYVEDDPQLYNNDYMIVIYGKKMAYQQMKNDQM